MPKPKVNGCRALVKYVLSTPANRDNETLKALGPKATAIAIKNAFLTEFNFRVDSMTHEVAEAWENYADSKISFSMLLVKKAIPTLLAQRATPAAVEDLAERVDELSLESSEAVSIETEPSVTTDLTSAPESTSIATEEDPDSASAESAKEMHICLRRCAKMSLHVDRIEKSFLFPDTKEIEEFRTKFRVQLPPRIDRCLKYLCEGKKVHVRSGREFELLRYRIAQLQENFYADVGEADVL